MRRAGLDAYSWTARESRMKFLPIRKSLASVIQPVRQYSSLRSNSHLVRVFLRKAVIALAMPAALICLPKTLLGVQTSAQELIQARDWQASSLSKGLSLKSRGAPASLLLAYKRQER